MLMNGGGRHTGMSSNIRCATVADSLEVARFLMSAKNDIGYFCDIDPDQDKAVQAFETFAVRPDYFYWVIERDGVINGVFIGLIAPIWWTWGDIANDLFFYVAPSSRGHGLKLINAYINWAKGFDSVRKIYLNVSTDDERVIKLIEQLGFKPAVKGFVMEVTK